ncbi:dUTP diphosphatase [Bacillus cytotoxicus]|uniref:dUTP diphosphatase n=1 Tax=Bacillus cytotoxicus TaxID=580165 RepID=A0ACC6A777_9BACI|nr:dUTP diphosphatase [Bacillus cytotoxicus]
MNLKQLFQMQKALDERIVAENKITHNRFDNLILALLDEVGECAKETRCFKDWSKKEPSPRKVILEEYVDGFHFVLSHGLLVNIEPVSYQDWSWFLLKEYEKWKNHLKTESLTRQFIEVYKVITDFSQDRCSYSKMFIHYLVLGDMLGFTHEEIEQAYLEKNKVNHQRQDAGY